ncbi:ThiS, thiamine-biosynthesis [mine drainage metagenome]|jgi:thiamine biosynthesis protein ThiS|uniref:ThiS, thiamine-biosynthesis n=1 Tax=mine drainage metagenome TaxID=410659 RepID=T0ZIG5_9ZZZZ
MSDSGLFYLNGEPYPVSPGKTVSALLKDLGFSDRQVVVELNLMIVQKEEWDKTEIKDADRLEIIGFVGGGSSS